MLKNRLLQDILAFILVKATFRHAPGRPFSDSDGIGACCQDAFLRWRRCHGQPESYTVILMMDVACLNGRA